MMKSQPVTQETVACSLIPRAEWDASTYNDKEKRVGRYHGSYFPGVPQLWIKNWVVVVDIDVDVRKLQDEGNSIDEIAQGCVNFLNLAPPRKKYAKKELKPLYGKLRLYKVCKVSDGRIQALLITDKQKSKLFWGEGARR